MFPDGIPLNAIRKYYGYDPIENLNEKENNNGIVRQKVL